VMPTLRTAPAGRKGRGPVGVPIKMVMLPNMSPNSLASQRPSRAARTRRTHPRGARSPVGDLGT
jgi:hypothetical protein